MNAISQNPFRTLGLFGNATEKELQKQIATIKRYAEVGKTKAFDFDFPFLGDFRREEKSVQEAASRIEQAKNKVHYSLFWFLNINHIDEAALNHLKDANIDKATEIWEKLIKGDIITVKNFSAAVNLSTLQLGMTTLNGSFNPAQFKRSIELKGLLLTSDAYMTFVQSVVGESSNVSREIILKEFVDEVLQILKPYLNKTNGITSFQLIEAFTHFPVDTKKYLSGKFTDKPISNIETQVEKSSANRNKNPSDAEQYGEELYKNTKAELAFLKNVLGSNNVQYSILANNVADEILRCALDFYGEYKEDLDFDPCQDTMRLLKMANSIAIAGQSKSRIQENIDNLQPLIDNPSKRTENIKFDKISDDLAYISQMVEKMEKASNSVSNAKNFSNNCKPKLERIKAVLGMSDEIYLGASSRVAHETMEMLIKVFVAKREALDSHHLLTEKISALISLKETVIEIIGVLSSLNSFDMVSELKVRYKEYLKGMQSQKSQIEDALNPAPRRTTSSTSSSRTGSSGSGGCYIATMAYGSYEHPQVLRLRKFRDDRLATSVLGSMFISFYYMASPKLVKLLQGNKLINSTIRTILDAFIKIIK